MRLLGKPGIIARIVLYSIQRQRKVLQGVERKMSRFQLLMVTLFISVGFKPVYAELLKLQNGKKIHFDDIPVNKFLESKDGRELKIMVDRSSSLYVIPFAQPRTIKQLQFEFKISPTFQYTSKSKLDEKAFDDWPLRVNLLIHGEAPIIPFFAPAWIKAIAEYMMHPSDAMRSIVPVTKPELRTTWESPYASSILHTGVLVDSDLSKFQKVVQKYPKPQKISGVLILADGDDTKQKFTAFLKNLRMD